MRNGKITFEKSNTILFLRGLGTSLQHGTKGNQVARSPQVLYRSLFCIQLPLFKTLLQYITNKKTHTLFLMINVNIHNRHSWQNHSLLRSDQSWLYLILCDSQSVKDPTHCFPPQSSNLWTILLRWIVWGLLRLTVSHSLWFFKQMPSSQCKYAVE